MFASSGCSYSQLEVDKVFWTPRGRERIVMTASPEEPVETQHVTLQGIWQIEEYARFRGTDFEAELILSFTPPHETVSLSYSLGLKDFVESWSFNHERPKVWLTGGRFYRRPATYFYRRYRLPDVNRECVAYTANWRPKADDPLFRPSRLSFGYLCLSAGIPLSLDDAESLLRRIEIRLPSESGKSDTAEGLPPRTVSQACLNGEGAGQNRALDFAQGTAPCNPGGNPSFPFKFALYYNIPHGALSR